MLKKWLLCLLTVCLVLFAFGAHALQLTEVRTEIGENTVAYPQLTGMENASVQSAINDEIVLSSSAANHLVTLLTLGENGRLQVDYEAAILEDEIFSAVVDARGKMPGARDGHVYTALTFDLATGEKILLEDLFTDVSEAIEKMEEIAETTLSEEFSGYMEASSIRPLPADSFTLSENGITFWYPADQFKLTSGYSGACEFWYEELQGLWKENSLPDRLLKARTVLSDDEIRSSIEESVKSGVLPHVPVVMNQSMKQVCDTFRLLREPDEFPGGKYFVLEKPAFRSILVISDALESAAVEGVQLKRGGLHGLIIGQTTRERWQQVLGAPLETVTVTENMAYDYNLPQGLYDLYHFGKNELRLYASEEGLLCAVQLCKP